MNILLLAHSFNSLTQRLWVELSRMGHFVSLELDINDAVTEQAVALAQPDLIIAPFLKRAIPAAVWQKHMCWIIHPGPPGDGGPSALDWAILSSADRWGVTVLQATQDLDAGPIWAWRDFDMRAASKSSLYRLDVTEAAILAVKDALDHYPHCPHHPVAQRRWQPAMTQDILAICWEQDDTETVLRKIRCSDGVPGVADGQWYLHDARPADGLGGKPGQWIARQGQALARATTDGAVWIGHLRPRQPHSVKLPAAMVRPDLAETLPVMPGHHDIWYDERHGVGYIHFPVHNGAVSTEQCRTILAVLRHAQTRPTKVIVLLGGRDFWCNGIHLGTIEAADSPADESWANITAMNEICRAIITCGSHITIAAMQGNAGAGGVFMALAADMVFARRGIVLNPHYKGMGNLYGSEYWTYLLPKRCGPDNARRIALARLPMGCDEALELGLIDDAFGQTPAEFCQHVVALAESLCHSDDLENRLARKRLDRLADEAEKPLDHYAAEELAAMRLNFYGFDPSYHVARWNFIRKISKSRTPLYLARHRCRTPPTP